MGGIDLSFAGLPTLKIPAIPLEVHLAEKLHALSLPRPAGRLNTRVKDLVDVILLQRRGLPPMNALRDATAATFTRRATHTLPTAIDVPTDAWEVGLDDSGPRGSSIFPPMDSYQRYKLTIFFRSICV